MLVAAVERRDGVAADLRTRVLAAASLAALETAVTEWAVHGGELPDLMDAALAALG